MYVLAPCWLLSAVLVAAMPCVVICNLYFSDSNSQQFAEISLSHVLSNHPLPRGCGGGGCPPSTPESHSGTSPTSLLTARGLAGSVTRLAVAGRVTRLAVAGCVTRLAVAGCAMLCVMCAALDTENSPSA